MAFAGLCALVAAFVPAVAKLTTDRADALFVAAATAAFAGAAAVLVLTRRGELALLVHPRLGPRLLLVGALGTGAAFWLLFLGARHASAIETTLCLQIEPAYSLIAAWLVLGDRPTVRRAASVSLLLIGIALAVGTHGMRAPSLGIWPLLATPLCWQLSHLIVVRGLVGVPPAVLTGARYVYGGLVLAVAWLLGGAAIGTAPGVSTGRFILILATQGIVLAYVGTILWYEAITRLDLARPTAIAVPPVPIPSLVATYFPAGEQPTQAQWAGVLLTAAGVIGFVSAPHAISTRPRIPVWTAPLAAAERSRRMSSGGAS